MIWDAFIMILALINMILVPVEVAWPDNFDDLTGYTFFDYFTDFIFLIDILLNFRTTLVNKYGEETKN